MYWFARAATTKCHKLGGLNSGNLLSHSSKGWKLEIKASVGLVLSEGCERESVLCLSPASRGLLAIFGFPWLIES